MEMHDVKIGDWVKDTTFPDGDLVGYVTQKGLAKVGVHWTSIFYKNGNCVSINNCKIEIVDDLELYNEYNPEAFKGDLIELALSIKNKSLFDCIFEKQ